MDVAAEVLVRHVKAQLVSFPNVLVSVAEETVVGLGGQRLTAFLRGLRRRRRRAGLPGRGDRGPGQHDQRQQPRQRRGDAGASAAETVDTATAVKNAAAAATLSTADCQSRNFTRSSPETVWKMKRRRPRSPGSSNPPHASLRRPSVQQRHQQHDQPDEAEKEHAHHFPLDAEHVAGNLLERFET